MSIDPDHLGAMRPRFAVDYSLVLCENILGLLWPLAIGLAVDGLIDGSRAGLWFFVGPRLSNTAVSFVRQRYESRTFNTLYVRETASELVYAEPNGALRETLLEIPVHEVMAILVRCCFQLPASRCTVRPNGFLDRE